MITSKLLRRVLSTNPSSTLNRVYIVHNVNRTTSSLGALISNRTNSPTNFGRQTTSQIILPIHCPLILDQNRFYSNINRKDINFKLEKSKQILTDNIELKRQRIRERKEILVQGIRDKKTKVQKTVRNLEEIVERENTFTIPNLLCVARSFLAPYIGYVIVQENYQLAIGLLVFAGITDLLDGFIARNWASQASKIGSFLDPMSDKLLVGSLVISLSYCNLFPVWLCGMIIFRDLFLIIAGFVIRYISLPPPRTLTRYFDATHVTAKLQPTFISKVNTAVQLATIAASLAATVSTMIAESTLVGLWYFTGFTTAAAATSYIFSKDTYKLIQNRKDSSWDYVSYEIQRLTNI